MGKEVAFRWGGRLGSALAIPVLAGLAGCDPCAGLGACGSPEIRYEGVVSTLHSDRPAIGVLVEFHRTGGVELIDPVLTGSSDDDGRFRLEGAAQASGEVVGDLVFHTVPPIEPTRVEGVRLKATRAAGDVTFAGRWQVPMPYLPYEASFYHRGSGKPAAGIEVEFRRTGGIEVTPDTFRVTTDRFGVVKLRPQTGAAGELTAEIVIYPLPPQQPYVIGNLRMRTFVEPRNDSTIVHGGLGPHLPYAGVLVWEGTGEAASDVTLEFRPVAGIEIFPSPFVTTTDSFGTFHLNPLPVTAGTVEGDLVVRSRAALDGVVVAHLQLQAFLEDAPTQHLGFFGVPKP